MVMLQVCSFKLQLFPALSVCLSGGSVILESPVLPVMEGDNVTLSCTYVTNSFSNITSYFYKDELFIGSSSTGNLTIHSVSKSDEGFYKCKISGGEQSPDSWLTVRGELVFLLQRVQPVVFLSTTLTSFKHKVQLRMKCH
uniref:Ig-like domain-containing protein n=1 Tax=Lates calcarifer TaxID=8187 RepID=A0A4W6BXN7_LATCA